ncbi:MAG: polysaccharide deacetylase family protein [Thermodesulfobacteriota bacterium]
MTMRFTFLPLLLAGFTFAAAGANAEPTGVPGTHFGSQAVLERCWSPEERLGRPEDRRPPQGPSDRSSLSAVRLRPGTTLPPLRADWRYSIRRVELQDRGRPVALTFDLCETAGARTGYDAAVVNVLRRHTAAATFFAGGKWMQTHAERAKQLMADPLFEIGNHTWTHPNCAHMEGTRILDQVVRTQAQYESLRKELSESPCVKELGPSEMEKIPRVPCVFRFPYGACSGDALRIVAEAGLAAIQWDVVMGDPVPAQNVSAMVDRVLGKVRPGSIIVGHANGRNYGTAEALEVILPQLAARGFHFVRVSELLLLGRVVTSQECHD